MKVCFFGGGGGVVKTAGFCSADEAQKQEREGTPSRGTKWGLASGLSGQKHRVSRGGQAGEVTGEWAACTQCWSVWVTARGRQESLKGQAKTSLFSSICISAPLRAATERKDRTRWSWGRPRRGRAIFQGRADKGLAGAVAVRTTPPPHGCPTGTPSPPCAKASQHHTHPHWGHWHLGLPHAAPHPISRQSSAAQCHSNWLRHLQCLGRWRRRLRWHMEYLCPAHRDTLIFKKPKIPLTTLCGILALCFAIPDVRWYHFLQRSLRCPHLFLSIAPSTEPWLG